MLAFAAKLKGTPGEVPFGNLLFGFSTPSQTSAPNSGSAQPARDPPRPSSPAPERCSSTHAQSSAARNSPLLPIRRRTPPPPPPQVRDLLSMPCSLLRGIHEPKCFPNKSLGRDLYGQRIEPASRDSKSPPAESTSYGRYWSNRHWENHLHPAKGPVTPLAQRTGPRIALGQNPAIAAST